MNKTKLKQRGKNKNKTQLDGIRMKSKRILKNKVSKLLKFHKLDKINAKASSSSDSVIYVKTFYPYYGEIINLSDCNEHETTENLERGIIDKLGNELNNTMAYLQPNTHSTGYLNIKKEEGNKICEKKESSYINLAQKTGSNTSNNLRYFLRSSKTNIPTLDISNCSEEHAHGDDNNEKQS